VRFDRVPADPPTTDAWQFPKLPEVGQAKFDGNPPKVPTFGVKA